MLDQMGSYAPEDYSSSVLSHFSEGGGALDVYAYRQIIDSLPQCIFWKDSFGIFLGCNAAGAKAIGLESCDSIVGKTDFDFHWDALVADYLRREDEKVMDEGVPVYRQLSQGSGPPESARWYETSKIPLRDLSGAVVGLLICYEDVTERQHVEAALMQTEAELIELNHSLEQRVAEATSTALEQERMMLHQSRHAAMGEMIGNITHQWRQPLSALSLLLQNVQYDSILGPMDSERLEGPLSQASGLIEKMSSTIDDFRNFFQPGEGISSIDICDCVVRTLSLMEASLKHEQISIVINLNSKGRVRGRSNELGQSFLNLLANAKDALVQNRTEDRKIWVDASDVDGHVRIRIGDNGGCISKGLMERMFDPYYTTKKSGTGLGLYIARRIITQHFNGSIDCNNVEGGVEFVVMLPVGAGLR